MSAYVDTRYSSKVIANDRGNYWRYYGLQRDPFMPIVEDMGYFLPSGWEQYFDLLHYLCESNNILLSVTGVKGSGKTTFMRQFIAQLIESKHICRLVGSNMLTAEQLKNTLIKDFALPSPQGESLDEQLETLLMTMQANAKPYLLVIDDAHRLLRETLQAILNLIKQQSEHQMRLHVLLVGESSLQMMLTSLVDSEETGELIHHTTLEPLSLGDTEAYIKHRLIAAGLPGAIPLSANDIARIYKFSEGVPGRINAVARQALIDVMQQRHLYGLKDFLRARRIRFVGGGVILVALFAVAFILTRSSYDPALKLYKMLTAPTAETTTATDNTEDTTDQKTMVLPTDIVDEPATSKMANTATTNPATQQKAIATPAVTNNKAAVNTPLPGNKPVKPMAAAAAMTISNNNLAVPDSTVSGNYWYTMPPVLFNHQTQNNTKAAATKVTMPAATEKMATQQATATVAPAGQAPATQAATAPTQAITATSAILTKPQPQPATATTAPSNLLVPGSTFISDPKHFTVQLIGVSSEASVKRFIAENQLAEQAYYYHSRLRNKDWYVIIYGNYANRQEAEQALQSLPQTVRDQHPWIRDMANVQKSVQRDAQQAQASAPTEKISAAEQTALSPASEKPKTTQPTVQAKDNTIDIPLEVS